jgi:hypothetical protein
LKRGPEQSGRQNGRRVVFSSANPVKDLIETIFVSLLRNVIRKHPRGHSLRRWFHAANASNHIAYSFKKKASAD